MFEDGFKCEVQRMFLKRMSYLNASALTTNTSLHLVYNSKLVLIACT